MQIDSSKENATPRQRDTSSLNPGGKRLSSAKGTQDHRMRRFDPLVLFKRKQTLKRTLFKMSEIEKE